MKHYKILILTIAIGLSSCGTKGQQPDNTKPMYGEIQKSDEYKKIDEDFKKECLDQFGTIDSSVNVQIDHAWRYFYHNDLKTAMKRFNQAWLLNSEFPDSYFGFAALLEMQNNKTEAERFYKIGQEKDKSKEHAKICYQRIADCKEQLRDFKGTIEAYTILSEINPSNVFAFKKIGYFQMQTGNTEDALTAYGKAIELDSKYISAYVNRGITEMEENNFDAAKKDFEISVQLNPKAGELRRMLGLAKISLKDTLGACMDFELAKKLGDTQADEQIKQNCK
jgi:tetratricopeptide (TPR) repeat protein